MGLFGRKEKQHFDFGAFLEAQRKINPAISLTEKVVSRVEDPEIKAWKSMGDKALAAGTNVATGFAKGAANIRMASPGGMGMVTKLIAIKTFGIPGAIATNSLGQFKTQGNFKQPKVTTEEIEADELIITDQRLLASFEGNFVVFDSYYDKNLLQSTVKGLAKRNDDIFRPLIPKPDKGEKYSTKAQTQINNIIGELQNFGYLKSMEVLVDARVEKPLGRSEKLVVEIAQILFTIHKKQKGFIDKQIEFETSLIFNRHVNLHKWEIHLNKDKNVDGKQIMKDFEEQSKEKTAQAEEYVFGGEKRKELSEQFRKDYYS